MTIKQRSLVTKPTDARRFDIASHGESYCVVDRDGREVSGLLSYGTAVAERDNLNAAAATSKRALARALGAVEDDDVEDDA